MLKCEPLWKQSETILSLSQNGICVGENYNKKIGKKSETIKVSLKIGI